MFVNVCADLYGVGFEEKHILRIAIPAMERFAEYIALTEKEETAFIAHVESFPEGERQKVADEWMDNFLKEKFDK